MLMSPLSQVCTHNSDVQSNKSKVTQIVQYKIIFSDQELSKKGKMIQTLCPNNTFRAFLFSYFNVRGWSIIEIIL